MAKTIPPGGNTGKNGGIYQEVGPKGGAKPNFATIPDNRTAPPTSAPGHTWKQVDAPVNTCNNAPRPPTPTGYNQELSRFLRLSTTADAHRTNR